MTRMAIKHAACALLAAISGASAGHAQDSVIAEAIRSGPPDEIVFTTWTGPYMRSQMLGFVRPYEDETGARVFVEHYDGGIEQIRNQVESANVIWDVVDLTQADSLRACDLGLLENLSGITLPDGEDGTPFGEDFVPGALNDCGVGVIEWATAFAYSTEVFEDAPPTTIADFFDTRKYPGPRAIRNDPSVIMEWALIADGVAPKDVYATLETGEGVARALKVMERIKPGLRFWAKGLEPVRLLDDGDVAMSMIWMTTGEVAARDAGAGFRIVGDGRVLELDLFGIPKGSRHVEAAKDFIRYASSSKSLANMASYLPNGPTRRSSLKIVSDEVHAQLPNGPSYADKASLRSDAAWWAENYPRLRLAFDTWFNAPAREGASGAVR